jgi:WXG100 family type VII secretion target
MAADHIEVDYEQLDLIGQRLQRRAESLSACAAMLELTYRVLQRHGWKGRAADRFYDEMETEFLPRLRRSLDVYEQSRGRLQEIAKLMLDGEERAEALFKAAELALLFEPELSRRGQTDER